MCRVLVMDVTRVCFVAMLLGSALGGSVKEVRYDGKNLDGGVLVLSVESLFHKGPHPMAPGITDVEICANYCKGLPGCNAYTFCASREGCPGDCLGYVAKHPQVPLNPKTSSPDVSSFPILGFGPFAFSSSLNQGCHYDFVGAQAVNKWPYGLCTLKALPEPAAPNFHEAVAAAGGWISGVFIRPPQCGPKVSSAACDLCVSSKGEGPCLKCAIDNAPGPMDALLGGSSRSIQDACGRCWSLDSPEARKKCERCLLKKEPCGECAYQTSPKYDVQSCMDCISKTGLQSPCVNCGSSTKSVAKCVDCVGVLSDYFCKPDNGKNASCISPLSQVCKTCTDDANSWDQCVSCAKKQPFNRDCEVCPLLSGAEQGRCYDCAVKVDGPGCFDCINNKYVSEELRTHCVKCVTSPETPRHAKSYCTGCTNWHENNPEKREKCYGCLKSAAEGDVFNQCKPL